MSGSAWIEVTPALLARLEKDFADVVKINLSSYGGDTVALNVTSPLLADNCHGCQEIIVEGSTLRFKRWTDT